MKFYKMKDFEVGQKYTSKVEGLEYEITKKNKTTCWVRLWEDGKKTDVIYKNVRYSILK